ncbi:HEAT repeat domain-containing protein [Streptomyces prunicolor]|uniref:HEAT repeat domain-containing protein n=1 Tax=Streptomyces prunicolor TaxID=67348 RepID=UPI0037D27AE4
MPAIREGLDHTHPLVREQCCKLLDELLVRDAVDDLTARLDDPDARVRIAAVHALSCDRCKPDAAACFPDRLALLPRGIRLLERDQDPQVRARDVELVGLWVHSRPRGTEPRPRRRSVPGRPQEGRVVHARRSRSSPDRSRARTCRAARSRGGPGRCRPARGSLTRSSLEPVRPGYDPVGGLVRTTGRARTTTERA